MYRYMCVKDFLPFTHPFLCSLSPFLSLISTPLTTSLSFFSYLRINTGYSTVASRIQKNRYAPLTKSTSNVGSLSDAEIEIIKRVIKRAEYMQHAEEIRIG